MIDPKRPLFFDRKGTPIAGGVLQWAQMLESEYRIVEITDVGAAQVSTIWTGLDGSFGLGQPLIFETLVLGAPGDLDRAQERYTTEERARAGHAQWVERVKRAIAERELNKG